MSEKYFLRMRGKVIGPFDMKQLQGLRARAKFGRASEISTDRRNWMPAGEVTELFPAEQGTTVLEETYETAHDTAPLGGSAAEAAPAGAVAAGGAVQWHYSLSGKLAGPVPTMVLQQLISSGQMQPTDNVWKEGMAGWAPAHDVPELQGIIAQAAGAAQQAQALQAQASGQKPRRTGWKIVAGVASVAVLAGLAYGGFVYFGSDKIVHEFEGEGVTTTALNSQKQIVDITTGDADAALADAVGLVACAWSTVRKHGDRYDETIVMERPVQGSIYGRVESVTNAVVRLDYEELEIGPKMVELDEIFEKLPNGEFRRLPSGRYQWYPRGENYEAGYYRHLVLGTTGTCFVITKDGYALTNRHVIEDAYNFQLAKDLVEEVRQRFQYQDITPTVYVFIAKKLYKAKIVFVSDQYDLCVLKIDRTQQATFRLSDGRKIPRGEKVFAIGFPGASRRALTELEARLKGAREETARMITEKFPSSDLEYTQTDGIVSRTTYKEGTGDVVQHNADINAGNSGGPLIDVHGIVYGINTWSVTQATGESGVFYAQEMKQFKEEITRNVPSAVVWVGETQP